MDAVLYWEAIDQATYEKEDRLDEEITLTEIAAHGAKLDERPTLHQSFGVC